MENCSKKDAKRGYTAGRWQLCRTRLKSRTALALLGTAWLSAAILAQGQTAGPRPELFLPDTPQPQAPAGAVTPAAQPCPAGRKAGSAAATAGTTVNAGNAPTGANRQSGPQVNAPQAVGTQTAGLQPASSPPAACPPQPEINWYARFVNGPQVKPMTPKEKAWLAARNVVGPFNALTILASSAIAVGSDAHSAYGPGMAGFGRSVGVSYTQDITGEFFGVFLIPSIAHQDPHYHRLLKASIPHRVGHAMLQVLWTEGDNGKGMVNYANIVGFAIDDEIGNLYVPGQQTNLPASAARYATGLALAPVGNFVSEFWPDVASHIHVRVVMIQWIVNHVGKSGSSGSF